MTKETKSKALNWLGILGLFCSFWFGIDRIYAKDATVTANRQLSVQTDIQVQQQMKMVTDDIYRTMAISDATRKVGYLTEAKYKLRDRIRQYPNDTELREELEEVNNELKIAKEKLDKLLTGN